VTCRFGFIPLENMLKKNEHLKILLSIILAAAVLTGVLTACSNNQNTTDAIVKKYAAVPVKEDEITRLNEQMFATAKMHADPSDYLLGAGDLLEITVFESESLEYQGPGQLPGIRNPSAPGADQGQGVDGP